MIEFKYSLTGGYLTSVKYDGENMWYVPDPRSWSGTDVSIFPFVARLKDGQYTVDGVTYKMKNHGLARYNQFRVVQESEDEVTLEFDSSEETLKQYPYPFEYFVNYKKGDDSITVSYTAKNTGEQTMYFGIGAHPALKVPCVEKEEETDISGNALEFEEEKDIFIYDFEPSYSFVTEKMFFKRTKRIELSKALFHEYPTLLLDAKDIKKVFLVKKDGSKVQFDFNANFLAIWSHPQYGDYVCVEPWMSLPDFVDCPSELKEKKTILSLEKGKEYTFSYKMTFIK